MKKLALALLLTAACRTTTVRPAPPPSAASGGGTGADAPRAAADAFLRAVQNEDLQALGSVWGTADGAARDLMPRIDMERRAIVMMRCFRHDSYRVQSDSPTAGGGRLLSVELARGNERRVSNFTVVPGKERRWYVQNAQVETLQEWCGMGSR